MLRRVVVLAAPAVDAGEEGEVFRRCLQEAAALGPDAMIVLASGFGSTADVQTIVSAALPAASGRRPVILPVVSISGVVPPAVIRAGGARLILPVSSAVIRGGAPSSQVLRALTAPADAAKRPAILFCAGSVATPTDVTIHQDLRTALPANAMTFVESPAGPAWLKTPAMEVFFVTPPTVSAESATERNGFFWITTGGGSPRVRYVRLDGIEPPSQLSWERHEFEQRLAFGLQATPLAPPFWTTTIHFRNTTNQTLKFGAGWRFSREGVRVDPEILGFRLAPGQEFRQKFRLTPSPGLPLRYASPEFVVRTTVPVSGTNTRNVEAHVRPWCVFSGRAAALPAPPAVDGAPDEWQTDRRAISHPDQVISGSAWWSGPDDASAELTCGWAGNVIYVAGVIHDDRILQAGRNGDRATLYIAASETTSGPPLRITVSAARSYEVHGGKGYQNDALRCAVRTTASEYSFEAAVPVSLLGLSSIPERFRLDLSVRDVDPGQPGPTVLYFSGNEEDEQSPRLMAVFECEPPPSPSPRGGTGHASTPPGTAP